MASRVSETVPIWLTLMRMELATFCFDALLQALGVGDEEVVADELDVVAELFGEELPAVPVVFGEAVFDGDDGVLADPVVPEVGHLLRRSSSRLSDFLKTYLPVSLS